MSDKQHIVLNLQAHPVALNVDRDQEPLYRAAAERINELYKKYTQLFPKLSTELIWVYVSLELATNWQSDIRDKNLQPVLDKIKELNTLIEQTLNS